MSQEIDISGVKVPAADWEATPESIKQAWQEVLRQMGERIANLEAENEKSRQRVAQLEENQRKNSRNSSQPPSRDGFGGKTTKGGNELSKRRKPLQLKRQERKRERELYASEQCQAVLRCETAGVQRLWRSVKRVRRQATSTSNRGSATFGAGGGGISIASVGM